MAQYIPLISISLLHTFFNRPADFNINMMPTVNSQKIISNCDLLFTYSNKIATISYNKQFSAALLEYAKDNEAIFLKVITTDSKFYTYTDINHKHNSTLYFETSTNAKKQKQGFLSESEFISNKDSIEINDSKLQGILDKKDHITPPVAIIKINLQSLLINNTIPDHQFTYTVTFEAKKIFWRYNLIAKNNNNFDSILIKDHTKKIDFAQKQNVILSDGSNAIQITSNASIPLLKFPNQQFSLVGIKNQIETIIINTLETPSINNITKENNRDISDIYIYF